MDILKFQTPLGPMAVVADGEAVTRLYLPNDPSVPADSRQTPLLCLARDQLLEYLDGSRRRFAFPMAPKGTSFQIQVWQSLARIPWGETRTYAQIAQEVGNPKGARAVGMANHRNPLPIFFPCHRVVGKNGALTGYGGGLDLKRALLRLEGHKLDGVENGVVRRTSGVV